MHARLARGCTGVWERVVSWSARSSAFVAFGLPLAYGVGFWLAQRHHAAGLHEGHEVPLLVHWLRDATLALPGVLVAVAAMLWFLDRLRTAERPVLRASAVALAS